MKDKDENEVLDDNHTDFIVQEKEKEILEDNNGDSFNQVEENKIDSINRVEENHNDTVNSGKESALNHSNIIPILLIIIIILLFFVIIGLFKPNFFNVGKKGFKRADFYGSYQGKNLSFPIDYKLFTDDGWYLYDSSTTEHNNLKYEDVYFTLYGLYDDNSEINLKENGVYGYVVSDPYGSLSMTWNGLNSNSKPSDFLEAYGEKNCHLSDGDEYENPSVKCSFDSIRFTFEFEEDELINVEIFDKNLYKSSHDESEIDYSTDNEKINKLADFYGSYNGNNLKFPFDANLFLNDGWKLIEDNLYENDQYPNVRLTLYGKSEYIDRGDYEEESYQNLQSGVYDFTIDFSESKVAPNITFNGLKPFSTKNDVLKSYGKPYSFFQDYYSYNFENSSYTISFGFDNDRIVAVQVVYFE